MISAVVLAAGMSTRMQRPKLMLPWGESTVIGSVITALAGTGVNDIVMVTGDNEEALQKILPYQGIRYVKNPEYKNGEMLQSVQVGLGALQRNIKAALIVLGDQPQLENHVVKKLVEMYASHQGRIIVPSYQMHRGHPWLIDRRYWANILSIQPPHTLRDFLNSKQDQIEYVNVDTPSVLQDLDTADDYLRYHP